MELLDAPIIEALDKRDFQYPSFARRWAANIIDFFVVMFVYLLLFLLLNVLGAIGLAHSTVNMAQTGETGSTIFWFIAFVLATGPLFILFAWLIVWLYYAFFESRKGGTLGKLLLGLQVTDLNGNKLTFGKATLRFFGRCISLCFTSYIGHIIAGFSSKKQALHDLIAGTLVVKKQKRELNYRVDIEDEFI